MYRRTNLSNGKCYVGSSVDIGRRVKNYFNHSFISNRNMLIHKALWKYGYSKFKFEILEYCGKGVVIVREQYYMDLLKPEYNILKNAGSTKGYKHTEETLAKFRARIFSAEHIAMLKEYQSKTNSEEQRAKARERMLEINKKKRYSGWGSWSGY